MTENNDTETSVRDSLLGGNVEWSDLYAKPQSTSEGMAQKDTVYPAIHPIYLKRDDGKFERLCNSNYSGNYAPEVREEQPTGTEPISEGWDDVDSLGRWYSCPDCAEIARILVSNEKDSQLESV